MSKTFLVNLTLGDRLKKDIPLIRMDINYDEKIDLIDIIYFLKILSGVDTIEIGNNSKCIMNISLSELISTFRYVTDNIQ